MLSRIRMAAGVVIALFALALAFEVPRSLLTEYGAFGSGAGAQVFGYVQVAAVGALLAGLGIWLAFRKPLWALAGGVALSFAAAVTGGMLGEAAHDRGVRNIATACTDDERAEFVALKVVPTNGQYGTGDSDGACYALVGGRDQSSLDELRRTLEGRGWKADRDETYAREAKRLQIVVRDEGGKGLDITLRFLSDNLSR